MDPSRYQPWLILALALVMGWFAVGIIWNIRRGNAVLRWLQTGLPRLGERTTLRWLGSSVVAMVGIAGVVIVFMGMAYARLRSQGEQ